MMQAVLLVLTKLNIVRSETHGGSAIASGIRDSSSSPSENIITHINIISPVFLLIITIVAVMVFTMCHELITI